MTLTNFQENLRKYDKILVTYGINVQPGQTVALSIEVEQAELACSLLPFPKILYKQTWLEIQPSLFVFSFGKGRKSKPIPSLRNQSEERKGCGHSAKESSEKSQEA